MDDLKLKLPEVPEVKVFITKDGKGYFFWCPFCKSYHIHGATGLGDRLAHCMNRNSEYKFGSYTLKEYTQKELKEIGLPTDYYKKRKKR